MNCNNCGKELKSNQKYCNACGKPVNNPSGQENQTQSPEANSTTSQNKKKSNTGKVISILATVAVIGFGIYSSLDDNSVEKNNEGIASFDSGDSQTAIIELQQAKNEAITNENKINALKNIAYVYESEEKITEALNSFKEALALTKTNSFDYHLISGEIALLENNPDKAFASFTKAYEIDSKDFQINNTLALFHIDLEEIAPQYVDYPKALDYAKKAYEYDVEKLEITKQNLAIAYYFNNNFDQTISLLSSTNFNQHPYAAYFLGLAYLNNEDDINARIYLQKAVAGGVEMPQVIYDYLDNN